METCREFESAIDRELAEGLTGPERDQLLEHLDRCTACSELFDLMTTLKRAPLLDEPSEFELAKLRRDLVASLPAAAAPPGDRAPRADRARSVAPGWRWALAAGLAGLALASGAFVAGRRSASAPRQASVDLGGASTLTAADLRRAGYRFASATVEESGPDKVRLAFDVARSVEVEVDRDDPLVTEVLVQSLVSPAELGSRLRAVESTSGRLDPRVRRALVDVMRRDENVGVRLAAQERLMASAAGEPDPATAEVVEAQLEVLEQEESVQMRLAAIDYLTTQRVDAARLTRAIEAGEPDGEQALFVRAGRYFTGPVGAQPETKSD